MRILRSLFLIILFAGTALTDLVAQDSVSSTTFDEVKADSFFSTLEEYDKFMGSVLVTKGEDTLYRYIGGYTDIKQKQKADRNTLYKIGSVSKIFTAVMILQLVREGKLNLTAPLSDFYPEIKGAQKINIDMMLRHRSGLYNLTDSAYYEYRTRPHTQAEILEKIAEFELDFEPGAKFAYSNTNFILSGYIIEAVTGKSYDQNLQERIAEPLGLKNTSFPEQNPEQPRRAKSYRFIGDSLKFVEEDHPSVPHGAGGIVSTPADMATMIRALFTSDILLNSDERDLLTNFEDGYGRGIAEFPYGGGEIIGHTGGIDGFVSFAGYIPEDDISVAVCANALDYTFNSILLGLVDICYGRPFEIPRFKEVELPESLLRSYEGLYSKEGFPLKITIAYSEGRLTGQGTGQSAFPLTAVGEREFYYHPAGIRIEFIEGGLMLYQGSMEVQMMREE